MKPAPSLIERRTRNRINITRELYRGKSRLPRGARLRAGHSEAGKELCASMARFITHHSYGAPSGRVMSAHAKPQEGEKRGGACQVISSRRKSPSSQTPNRTQRLFLVQCALPRMCSAIYNRRGRSRRASERERESGTGKKAAAVSSRR